MERAIVVSVVRKCDIVLMCTWVYVSIYIMGWVVGGSARGGNGFVH